MNYYGNLIDTSAIAAIIALLSTKLPTAKLTDDGKTATWAGGFMPVPLKELPLQITFAKIGDVVVVDPSLSEELVQDGRISVGVTESNRICSIQKKGTALWSQEEIVKLLNVAIEKDTELRNKINIRQYTAKV